MAVHAQTTCTLSTIPAKTSLLKGHFLFSDGYANVIEKVDNSSSNWKSNVHIGANGIQLRYNNIILSEWAAKTITPTGGASISPNFTFYYPKENTNTGVVSQGLSALKLSAGGMSLYRDSDTNERESVRKLFDLGSSGLIFYGGGTGNTNPTPIARFSGSGVQIGKDGMVNAYVTSNSFVLRNENVSPIRTFFKVEDGLVGEGSHTDSFIGDGIEESFDLTYNADSSTYTVKKNDIEVGSTEVNKTTSSFTFNNAPAEGDVITATYNVTRPSISSCTLGIRGSFGIEGDYSVAEGFEIIASGFYSHAEGKWTEANGNASHAEGNLTKADGADSHSEGHRTQAIGGASHAEGAFTIASGSYSHAEGSHTTASGLYSHAEGSSTIASDEGAHAEGLQTKAKKSFSHAEGIFTEANGYNSHVEGFYSKVTATGVHSHAEGFYTTASHIASHAGGYYTQTSRDSQTVIGEYNKDDTSALFIIGNGTSGELSDRKNAFTVDTNGNVNISSGAKYKINGTALSASDVGALPTTGGNVSGNISYKLSSIDASLANNGVSSTQYPTTFNILDKSERILTRKEAIIESNGNIGSYWYVRNYNTSGTQVAQKGIKMTMDKSGNLTYTIQDAANFRTALGLGSLATKNSLSASDVSALPSNYFIFDPYSLQITVGQGTTNITMGTLKQHSGYTLRGYINQNGGYTDQWLISYGTYGSNVVAMVYSKYNGSLTQTISCTAVWTKNS